MSCAWDSSCGCIVCLCSLCKGFSAGVGKAGALPCSPQPPAAGVMGALPAPPPSARVLAHLMAQLPSKVRTGADTVQEVGLMWMVLKSGNHSGPFWGPRDWKDLQELSNLLSSESLKPHPSLHLPTAGTLTTTPDTQLHGDSWNCGRALPFLMSY